MRKSLEQYFQSLQLLNQRTQIEKGVDSYVDIAYGFAVRFKFSFHLAAIIERPKSPLKKIVRIKNYGINIK